MYLVDTNIWLEYLLNQARAQDARQFLAAFDGARYSISVKPPRAQKVCRHSVRLLAQ